MFILINVHFISPCGWVHISITLYSCLVVFAVFAFLLASAEVMYISHDVVLSTQFIRISACLVCVVYLLDSFSMVDCLQNFHFFGELNTKWIWPLRVKSYSLRPLCETSFTCQNAKGWPVNHDQNHLVRIPILNNLTGAIIWPLDSPFLSFHCNCFEYMVGEIL